MSNKKRNVLFCRSGGGMPGVDIHLGIWLALEEAGIVSTHNCGTSAGAILAALDSTGKPASHWKPVLTALCDEDVRRERIAWKLRVFWIEWFMGNELVREQLEKLLPAKFVALQKSLSVYTLCEINNQPFAFSLDANDGTGRLIDAILASSAIAGVFPPVCVPGMMDARFSDGGTVNYCALPDNWQDYDDVYMLIAAPQDSYPVRRKMIDRLIMNAQVLMESHILATINHLKLHHKPYKTRVHIIRPTCGAREHVLRFNHDLINEALIETRAILAQDSRSRNGGQTL